MVRSTAVSTNNHATPRQKQASCAFVNLRVADGVNSKATLPEENGEAGLKLRKS